MELLDALFHHVCGQSPDRTWLPGGVLLPVCERCTGLYVGAALALGLLLWLRPRLSRPFLALHGAFLLGMAPFGLHWIEHGPAVRTITGLAFGAAVVVFLSVQAEWAVPSPPRPARQGRRALPGPGGSRPVSGSERNKELADAPTRRYLLALGFAAGAIPALCAFGGQVAAMLLAALIAVGGACLAMLVLFNGVVFLGWLVRLGRRLAAPAAA